MLSYIMLSNTIQCYAIYNLKQTSKQKVFKQSHEKKKRTTNGITAGRKKQSSEIAPNPKTFTILRASVREFVGTFTILGASMREFVEQLTMLQSSACQFVKRLQINTTLTILRPSVRPFGASAREFVEQSQSLGRRCAIY